MPAEIFDSGVMRTTDKSTDKKIEERVRWLFQGGPVPPGLEEAARRVRAERSPKPPALFARLGALFRK